MSKMSQGAVAIAGGGIGGLAAAAALGRAGLEVHVYEARPEFGEEGAGIALGENAFRALEWLGVRTSYPNASTIEWMDIRDHRQRPVLVGPPRGRLQWVPRSDLHLALLDAAQAAGAKVTPDAPIESVTADGTVRFKSGESTHADLVVLADGIGSRLRLGLQFEVRLQRLHHQGIRAPMNENIAEAPAGWMCERWSGPLRVGYARMAEGKSAVWLSWPATDGHIDPRAWKQAHPGLSDLLDRVFATNPPVHPFSVVHAARWSDGRVVAIGDAAHAMPPHMGQGGALALQDAAILGEELVNTDARRADDLRQGLAAWEARRRRHVSHVSRHSVLHSELQRWPRALVSLRTPLLRALYHHGPVASMERGRKELEVHASV